MCMGTLKVLSATAVEVLQEHPGERGNVHKHTARGHRMASRVEYIGGGIETKSTTGNRRLLEWGKVRGTTPLFIEKEKGGKSNKSGFNL